MPSELLEDPPGNVLCGGIVVLERRQFIEVPVVEVFEQPVSDRLDFPEIEHHSEVVEGFGPEDDLHFPVVPVEAFAGSLVAAEVVSCREMCLEGELEHWPGTGKEGGPGALATSKDEPSPLSSNLCAAWRPAVLILVYQQRRAHAMIIHAKCCVG